MRMSSRRNPVSGQSARAAWAVAAVAAVLAGTAVGAKPTVTIAWTQVRPYDSEIDFTGSNVLDGCGGTGRIPLSGTWVWDSTVVLEPYGDYPNGLYNFNFVRARISVTYDLRGVTNGGVTYTGTGKVSTNDFPLGYYVSLTSDDKLKGSDGSVLGVHQTWNAQYGASVFQGHLDAAGMNSWVSGGSCVKAARPR